MNRKKITLTLKIYGAIALGSLAAALSINLFLAPLQIVAGGASGAAIIINKLCGLPIGLTMLSINVPLFVCGMRSLGRGFAVRSLVGAFLFSALTDLTAPYLPVITHDPLLAALSGGTLLGLGLGTVFLTGATTGGTDILAKLGHRLIRSINVGQWMFLIDFFIIAINGAVFHNYEFCLYGLIALFVSSYLIDFVIQGANTAKMVYIISPKYEQIANAVMQQLSRGVTGIRSSGMYTRDDKTMLMCIVKKFEIQRLEQIAMSCDPNAFLILSQVHQVRGEGFRIYPEH